MQGKYNFLFEKSFYSCVKCEKNIPYNYMRQEKLVLLQFVTFTN